MSEQIDNLLQRWASIGAGFNIESAGEDIDLERLLETALHAPENRQEINLLAAACGISIRMRW